MRSGLPIVLAFALALDGCAAHNPPASAVSPADIGAAEGRQCFAARTPVRLPDAAALVRWRALRDRLGGPDAGHGTTILSLRFDAAGRPARSQVLLAGAGYEPSIVVGDAVRRVLRPQRAGRPWGVRLAITTGDSVTAVVSRQEICPARPLNGRIEASFTDADGAAGNRPAFGMSPGFASGYDAAGYQQVHARVRVTTRGTVADAALADPGPAGSAGGTALSRRGTLAWLYDLTFQPLLIDGIPSAAWVDIWFYLPSGTLRHGVGAGS